MNNIKTKPNSSMFKEYNTDNLVPNLKRCIELASTLSEIDTIQPTSSQSTKLSELLYRVKNMPEVDYIDFNEVVQHEMQISGVVN